MNNRDLIERMMMKKTKKPTSERLSEVLGAYGGNSEKWPAEERAALVELIEARPELRAMLDEAETLDTLLNQAGAVTEVDITSAADGIMERIGRAADRELLSPDHQGEAMGKIVELDSHRKRNNKPAESANNDHRKSITWQMAGLLAASFALGIYIGATQFTESAAEGVAQIAGRDTSPALELTLFQSETADLFEGGL